jgi:hypothetical protein
MKANHLVGKINLLNMHEQINKNEKSRRDPQQPCQEILAHILLLVMAQPCESFAAMMVAMASAKAMPSA